MITKLGVTLSLAILFAPPCVAQDAASQKFLKEAIEGNFAEVQMGQLAKKQASSDGVRSFGEMLEKDHSSANQKATAAATSLGMTPPTSPNKKQTADSDRMSKLSGAQFDKAFVTHMVADHKKDIKEYEKAAKKKDAAGSYAAEILPTLRKHLDTAQSLSGASKTAHDTANPPAVMAVPAPAAGVPRPRQKPRVVIRRTSAKGIASINAWLDRAGFSDACLPGEMGEVPLGKCPNWSAVLGSD